MIRPLRARCKSNRRRPLNLNRVMRGEALESRRLLAGDAPTFVSLGDQTIEVGAPLHLPVDGFDSDGGVLTVSVEVSNPDAVTAELITGNRSLRLDVASFGTMVFELYETRVPRPTQRIIDLTEDGFYDGITFHRVDSDFVLQAGSPDGSGSTGSDLGSFDDQFHPDLQHNQKGTLSFAKTTDDDTNNSQFFVTATDTRFLDYNHSVFGQLVDGEDVRQAISEVAIDPATEKPLTDVVIETATIFEDFENSVIMLRAIDAGVQSDVTITITDEQGNFFSETITASTIADQLNAGPYFADIPKVVLGSIDQSVSYQLEAFDNEGDDVEFSGQFISDSFGSTASLDPQTGLVELQPADGFVGTIDLIVRTRASTNPGAHLDSQVFSIQIVDSLPMPTSIDLSAVSDTGIADDDNITAAINLTIQIDGVTPGADIEIVNQANGEVLGQARASAATAVVNIDLADDFFGADELDGTLEIIARQRTGDLVSEAGSSLEIQIDRTLPELTSSPIPDHLFAANAFSQTLTTNEVTGRWSLVSGPDGMTIDESTGEVTWTPDSDLRGLQPLTIGFQDAAGNALEASSTINVTSRYVNLVDAFDVDGSGTVNSLDALLVINAISPNGGVIQLPETDGSESEPSPLRQDFFYNTNGDLAITALDALVVINELARRQAGGGPSSDGEFITPIATPSSIQGMRTIDDERDDDAWLF